MKTPLYNLALGISIDAHDEQTRNDGTPYIYHPIAVASAVDSEREKVTALLHDVIEDTDITAYDLLEQGIPSKIVDDLELLTHQPKDDYYDYILKICTQASEEAMWVKYQDIEHNLQTTKGKHRIAKYKLAQFVLMGFIVDE
jgi:(p)ppGpp synthase/HD superfamily hydrolase